jgi:hypothetical protein
MEKVMQIRITEPPEHPGLNLTYCRECGREVIWAETISSKKICLDDTPGPYRLEEQDDGVIRAVYRYVEDGYAFHFNKGGKCLEEEPQEPRITEFERIRDSLADG